MSKRFLVLDLLKDFGSLNLLHRIFMENSGYVHYSFVQHTLVKWPIYVKHASGYWLYGSYYHNWKVKQM